MNVSAPDWGSHNGELACLTGNDLFPVIDRLSRIGKRLVLNGPNLISKSGSFFKLKIACCRVHPILKLLDDFGGFLGRYRRMRVFILGLLSAFSATRTGLRTRNGKFQNILNALNDALGNETMCLVVGLLLGTTSLRFLKRSLNTAGDYIGIENRLAMHITGGSPNGLD